MRRRDFIGTAAAAVAGTPFVAASGRAAESGFSPYALEALPSTLGGKSPERLRDEYRDRLFRRYLPFWHRGGLDEEFGGIMCELDDEGAVVSDEKFIWYQGRAVWVYSYLYNNFGRDERFLEIARRIRDFMVDRDLQRISAARLFPPARGRLAHVCGPLAGNDLDRDARGPQDQGSGAVRDGQEPHPPGCRRPFCRAFRPTRHPWRPNLYFFP